MSQTEFDLCVLGGGSAGLVTAAGAAQLGARVALVEQAALGGDCLWHGCVPSKALLHSAAVAQTLRTAERGGIPAVEPAISLPAVMERVARVIATIQPNDSPERFRGMGVDVIFGRARFTGPGTVVVDNRRLTARHFVLATGSRPRVPVIPGLDKVPFLTNETVFGLREPVPHLLVLGAGPIGIELAQAFRRLGSQVEVIDPASQVLGREDAELAEGVRARLAAEGVRFHLGTTVERVSAGDDGVHLQLRGGSSGDAALSGSHLLLASGRLPNVEDLGLDAAGVALDGGRLVLDGRLRTTNRRIFACGDVAGPFQFTHMAEHQAGVVLRNALFHLPARSEMRVVPWCTFTDPELARVGLSEREARQAGMAHEVYSFPYAEIDRAIADEATEGRAKILVDPRGRILGAAILGAHAGELIHEYVLAMATGMKIGALAAAIHIYPTLAQINRRVANERLKRGLTPGRRRWLQRLFRLRGGAQPGPAGIALGEDEGK